MGAVTNHRRRAVEEAQANSPGGLLTRLNLLAQRHGADVVIEHNHRRHRWTVGVEWVGDGGIGGGHARKSGGSLVDCLTDVLHRVRA